MKIHNEYCADCTRWGMCKHCEPYPKGLLDFVHLWLDQNDIRQFQYKNYYHPIISAFLKAKFHWPNNNKPQDMDYNSIEELPFDLKIQAIDCLGHILNWPPRSGKPGELTVAVEYYLEMINK